MKRLIKQSIESGFAFAARNPLVSQSSAYRLAETAYRWRDDGADVRSVKLAHGVEMTFDRRQWQDRMMAYQVYEKNLLQFMKKILRPGDHFVDVGANIGFVSLFAEKIVGSAGTVDAFEPHPGTREKLKANVSLNNSGVRIRDTALGREDGVLDLIEYGNASGLTSVFDRGDELGVRKTITCQQTRLDSLPYAKGAAFIKLDCEGSEGAVIEGAEGIICGANPPVIYFEYCQEWRAYGGRSLSALCDQIKDFHKAYEFYDLDRSLVKLERSTITDMNEQSVVNVCCVPNQ